MRDGLTEPESQSTVGGLTWPYAREEAVGVAAASQSSAAGVTEMKPSGFFSSPKSIITMSNTQEAVWPSYADRKEGLNHDS